MTKQTNINDLIRPSVPPDFADEFFNECGLDLLWRSIYWRFNLNHEAAYKQLLEVVTYFRRYKTTAEAQGGLISADMDSEAKEMLFTGWAAMGDLEGMG